MSNRSKKNLPKLEKILFAINLYDQTLANPSLEKAFPSSTIAPSETSGLTDQLHHREINLKKIPQNIQWKKYNHFAGKKSKDWDLFYVFKNGKSVSGEDIFYHDYSYNINRELMPTLRDLKNLEPYFQQSQPLSIEDEYRWAIIETLWRAQKLKNLLQIDVGLFFGTQLNQAQKVYPIDSLNFIVANMSALPEVNSLFYDPKLLQTQQKSWKTLLKSKPEGAELWLQMEHLEGEILFRNFSYHCESKKISFHPFRSLLDRLCQKDPHLEFSDPSQPHILTKGNLVCQDWAHYPLDTQFGIEEEVDSLLKDFPFLKEHYATEIKKIEIAEPDYFTKYEFEKDRYHIELSIKTPQSTIHTTGWPKEWRSLYHVATMGLISDPYFELKLIKPKKMTSRSSHDKKLLKHRGIALYIIDEMISHVLNHSQPRETDSFVEKTLQGINQLFLSSLKLHQVRSSADLKELCSPKIIHSLEDWMVAHIHALTEPLSIFCEEGELSLQKGYQPYLIFLQSFIHYYVSDSKSECFFKPNKKYFPENLQIPDSKEGLIVTFQPDQKVKKIFLKYTTPPTPQDVEPPLWSFLSQKVEDLVLVHGKKLQILNQTNFKAEFNIEEKSNEDRPLYQSPIDWFALNPMFFLNGEKISTEEALKFTQTGLIEHNGEYFILSTQNDVPSSQALNWFWKRIKKGFNKDKKKKFSDNVYPLQRSQTLELLALRKLGVPITGGPEWNQICEFYDSLDQKKKMIEKEPETFQFPLKNYQREGLNWMLQLYRLHLGGILADDMGLGKTIQTLAFFETLRLKKELGHTLVIVPTSLTYNWVSESEKFTPHLKVMRFQSQNQTEVEQFLQKNDHCILICSYGLFTSSQDFFKEHPWNIEIFDEGQHLKNIKAKRTTAARQSKARFKLCLTGTPIENHYDELYSLLDLTTPGALGDLDEFRKVFIHPVLVESENIQELKLKVKPLILRRTKKEILTELPDKTEVLLKIPFEKTQKEVYRDIAISWNNKVRDALNTKKEGSTQLMMLTALLRLRQACSDPSGIPGVVYNKVPPKIETLIESLKEITEEGHSALVFTQFMTTLDRIARMLKSAGISTYIMHGSITQKKREATLKAFNEDPKGCVFLMTLKTGGVGLNLTKANYVFHLEPWWNPSVENQATDRTHRIGQKKAVTIYRLLMQESVEEKVEILKSRKAARFSSLFGTDEKPTAHFKGHEGISQKDFEYLIHS